MTPTSPAGENRRVQERTKESGMTYLGTVKVETGRLLMPLPFATSQRPETYEAVEVAGDILLVVAPLDRARLRQAERLAERSIADHRASLEGLAR